MAWWNAKQFTASLVTAEVFNDQIKTICDQLDAVKHGMEKTADALEEHAAALVQMNAAMQGGYIEHVEWSVVKDQIEVTALGDTEPQFISVRPMCHVKAHVRGWLPYDEVMRLLTPSVVVELSHMDSGSDGYTLRYAFAYRPDLMANLWKKWESKKPLVTPVALPTRALCLDGDL